MRVSIQILKFRFLEFLVQKTLIFRFRHIFPRKRNILSDNSKIEELIELKI